MAELGILQPAVDQVSAGVDLIEVFGMVGAVPFVGQVVEAVGLGDLVVFVAVPGHKVAHIERVELGALLGAGSQRQGEVLLGHAVAQQFFHGHAHGHAVLDLVHGGVGLLVGVAAVLKADVLAIAEHRGVELGRHMQREGVDQAVDIPGRLAILLKEFAHQDFLHLDVGLAGDDGAAKFLADIFQVVDAGLRHGEVILNAEEDGVHVHDLFQHPDLEVAVLAAGNSHSAVVSAGAVHAAVLVAVGLKLFKAGIPIHIFAVLVVAAGAAHALGIKSDPRPGIRHRTFFAVTHKFLLFIGQSFGSHWFSHVPRRMLHALLRRNHTYIPHNGRHCTLLYIRRAEQAVLRLPDHLFLYQSE